MPWYYYTDDGLRQGPVSGTVLKTLAKNGIITKETVIENDSGQRAAAKKFNGLVFLGKNGRSLTKGSTDIPPIRPMELRSDEKVFSPSNSSEVYDIIRPVVPNPKKKDIAGSATNFLTPEPKIKEDTNLSSFVGRRETPAPSETVTGHDEVTNVTPIDDFNPFTAPMPVLDDNPFTAPMPPFDDNPFTALMPSKTNTNSPTDSDSKSESNPPFDFFSSKSEKNVNKKEKH